MESPWTDYRMIRYVTAPPLGFSISKNCHNQKYSARFEKRDCLKRTVFSECKRKITLGFFFQLSSWILGQLLKSQRLPLKEQT